MTDRYGDVPVLDQAVVDELRESVGGDDEFVRDLVATYVEEVGPHLGAMADAAASGDAGAIVRPAHTLKSTSASIGAMRLSAICRDLEAGGREGRSDGLHEAVDSARSAWTETLKALRGAGLAA
ncbi:MAG TPA: Hpt domain-containing protein [Candidatus Limnocylindrales bacterium]|nr:Hpt domain-containing protein [Candidatus Limnocylindrales bacterium]